MKALRANVLRTRKTQVVAALFVFPTVLLSTLGVHAQQCSTKTTEGRYLVVCDGFLTPGPQAPLVAAKEIAIATADEYGTFTGKGTLSLGGQIAEQTVKGTEQINPDCTGSITYAQTINGQPAPDLQITFVVSDHGNRIDGMAINPGSVFSCVLRRLDHPREDW